VNEKVFFNPLATLAVVARLSLVQYIKMRKNHQMTKNICNSYVYHIPKNYKIYHMAVKYTKILNTKAFQNLPKIAIFVLEMYHVATLHSRTL
jgi:hypothetical protein